MPRIKKARVAIRIDMTPMVDVAFLLLTFFMLTTQFKPPEDIQIKLPTSHSEAKLPETNTMTVNISEDGKIYLGFDAIPMMEYVFGSANRLKQAIEVNKDSLATMLMNARIRNPKLSTIVKSDSEADYGTVSDVIDILYKTRIIRFAMVTNYTNK